MLPAEKDPNPDMPFLDTQGMKTFYRLEGGEGKPVLVLSHSIGADHGMWEPQIGDLIEHFQVLRYDTRGHGASAAPVADYTIDQLGEDILALTDALGIRKFAFCGLSLGGAIGQWLALNAPEHIERLILANTTPKFGSPEQWQTRIRMVNEGGMRAILELALQRFFSKESIERGNPYVFSIKSVILGTNPAGYAGCCAALRDFDSNPVLEKISTPTLIISGQRDVSTPWAGNGEVLARKISRATSVQLDAAHLSNLERPRSFSSAVLEFLLTDPDTADDPLQKGFVIRRAVLGDEHVDRAIAGMNDFNREFQDLITRYAWGTVWTRPGLDIRTRRLLVLAITAALGRHDEFRLHVKAGLKDGLELSDLKEVLLQTAIYAGVPAANTAFQIAREETEAKKDP
jgi:3-oxoadipate enol-lactonase / 4-carboxymuconolactone decarboxylase